MTQLKITVFAFFVVLVCIKAHATLYDFMQYDNKTPYAVMVFLFDFIISSSFMFGTALLLCFRPLLAYATLKPGIYLLLVFGFSAFSNTTSSLLHNLISDNVVLFVIDILLGLSQFLLLVFGVVSFIKKHIFCSIFFIVYILAGTALPIISDMTQGLPPYVYVIAALNLILLVLLNIAFVYEPDKNDMLNTSGYATTALMLVVSLFPSLYFACKEMM